MMRHKVELCGVNTSTLPVLTNEEMKVLFVKLQKGDEIAREELCQGNLRLVLSIIQRFSHRGENVDDLFQVGCIGLMKSIDNFDLRHNVRFSTYAVPMIIGEIRRYLRDNSPVRVARSLRDIAYKALRTREQLLNETSKEPSTSEIAQALEIPLEDVVLAMSAIQDPISLFEPVYNDGGDPIYVIDQVHDETDHQESWTNQLSLKAGMDQLAEREKMIVQRRFYQGKTQTEVAEEIGISQAQVSRLEKSAIAQMNKSILGDMN